MPKKGHGRPEDFFAFAHRAAVHYAWNEADVDDIRQESLTQCLVSEARHGKPEYPATYFPTIIHRTARGYYNQTRVRGQVPSYESYDTYGFEDLEEGFHVEARPDPDVLDSLFLEEFLEALEKKLGRTHAWAVRNLLEPAAAFCYWLVLSDSETKGDGKVTHKSIRDALGLSIPGWFKLLGEIRRFTIEFLDGQI